MDPIYMPYINGLDVDAPKEMVRFIEQVPNVFFWFSALVTPLTLRALAG